MSAHCKIDFHRRKHLYFVLILWHSIIRLFFDCLHISNVCPINWTMLSDVTSENLLKNSFMFIRIEIDDANSWFVSEQIEMWQTIDMQETRSSMEWNSKKITPN